ncbi:MAG: CBS domain-containing protein [Hydrogenophaga sp.]|uniref:CBS domain-containing protein n=1 Tax=Hydrogenophaga sp. TaxID=1904254 RepID=UPI002720C522|nr:CBS domain-containing protein [Hydrogenophaga sp.]MDO9146280.1 CBS domain-containing protein [Hydrogenophaga sp.]MDO9604709.1 CBS domain-containing protein [Hydrogenophaga sp.]MDP3478052.1 CBS domain-containing protein [Hydrogenophaga sp.]
MNTLTTFRFPEGACIAQAQPHMGVPVTLTSPARAVMTDLTHVRAATISPDTPLTEARQTMIHQGVRLLFVVSEMPCVDGLITSTDLEGERPMQVLDQRGVKYEDLVVVDVMSPLSKLDAIDLDELAHADVAKVIATLKQLGRRHMLVVQRAGSGHGPRVRGVISQTQIERQLGQPIDVVERANNFAEISVSLAG